MTGRQRSVPRRRGWRLSNVSQTNWGFESLIGAWGAGIIFGHIDVRWLYI